MTTPAAIATLAACAAVLVALPAGDPVRRLGSPALRSGQPSRGRRPDRRRAWIAGGSLAALGLCAVVGRRYLLVGAGALVIVTVARRIVLTHRLRGSRRRRQRAAIGLCDDLAAEVRAGIPALTAVERSCRGQPDLASVISAARLGGDIAAALRLVAERPGAEGLRAVAAGWEVASTSGAGLAIVLDRIAAGLRSDDDARAEVTAALAPPRATARLLAVLPVFGLALGSSIGANPVRFLVATTWGLGCLSCGAVLALTGVWWVERLASAAEL